jgi:flagellar biosynthesis component FlhA
MAATMDDHPATKNLTNQPPIVALRLELAASLGRLTSPDNPLQVAIRQSLVQALTALMHTLGVPGEASAEIDASTPDAALGDRFMRLMVNGEPAGYPNELLQMVHSYVNASQPDPSMTPSALSSWLGAQYDRADNTGHGTVVEFLTHACMEITKQQPALLLGMSQVDAYVAAFLESTDAAHEVYAPSSEWLHSVLSSALNGGTSIANMAVVVDALSQVKDKSVDDAIEALIVALRPGWIEIRLPLEYLKELTEGGLANKEDTFTTLRDGMFTESGIVYPDFRFVPDERLKLRTFAFTINSVITLPFVGLRRDECLVNETAERLVQLHDIEAHPAMNPATGQFAAVTVRDNKELLEKDGLTTWGPMAYLILCFVDTLRKRAGCFIDRKDADDKLKGLEAAFPGLVQAARSRATVEKIARLLRGLAMEGISIRNLRLILERLLDYEYCFNDSAALVVLDDYPFANDHLYSDRRDDPASLLSFVRAGLQRQISGKYARGTTTMDAYLLGSEIEQLLASRHQPQDLGEHERDAILSAIRAKLADLPPNALLPVILTRIDVRTVLRRLISKEFPRLSVVGYQELMPNLTIRPIARISLKA